MKIGKLIEGHPATYWERKSGIPSSVIYMRFFRLKWPLDKILNTPTKSHAIDYNGRHYNSLAELCKSYGKNFHTVQSRLSKGLSLNDALTIAKMSDPRKQKKQEDVCGHADCFTCPYHDCIYPDY